MSEVHLCRPRVDPGENLATCDHVEPQSMRITMSVMDRFWHKRVETLLKWYKPVNFVRSALQLIPGQERIVKERERENERERRSQPGTALP